MGQAGVIPGQLLGADKVDAGVILVKVIGHGLDLPLDALQVGARFGHHPALPQVLVPRRQNGLLAPADGVHRALDGNGIPSGVHHPCNAADGVGVALADAAAPEGLVLALGQHRPGIDPGQREQAGVPAAGDQSYRTGSLGSRIHRGKVLRNLCVGIEAVHHVEQSSQLRRLMGQVRGAAAAQDHHVHGVPPGRSLICGQNGDLGGAEGQTRGIPAGKDSRQLQIVVLGDRRFHASAQVAIAKDCDSGLHCLYLHQKCIAAGALPVGGICRPRLFYCRIPFRTLSMS